MKLPGWIRDWAGELKPFAGDWAEAHAMAGERSDWRQFPMQPLNSYSNVAYVLAGLVVLAVRQSPEAAVFALAMLSLALGSFFYHAWPTRKTAALDHAGMYAAFLALVLAAGGAPWFLVWIGAAAGSYALRYAFSVNLNLMMGLFLYLAMSFGWGSGYDLMIASLVCFLLSMMFWQFDRAKRWKYGHLCWHVLTSAAIATMYMAGTG